MPKKQKKPLNKKPLKKSKIKSVVNVKINIDNSKKPTMRRASTKAPQQQPFVNFPTFQPTRIQQLEPKQQFNNADLTKTMDEYQKQFKTYLETKDQNVKDIIEKFDDTLKKNIAPPKKERSQPGAYDTYADDEGNEVFEQRFKKYTWTNSNELNRNTMLETEVEPLTANQLFEEARPVTTKEIVRGLGPEEKDEAESELKNVRKEDSVLKKYEDYVNAYKRYYGDEDENYDKINELNSKGKTRDAKAWSKKTGTLERKIVERTLEERNNPKKIILTGPPKRVSLTEEEEEEP